MNASANSDVASALSRLEARLEQLEKKLAPVTEVAAQVPALSATAADILDDQAARLGDLEQRLSALVGVTERLTRPQTLATLGRVVDLLEGAPALTATATDIFDEVMNEAAAEGLELTHLADHLKHHLVTVLKLTASPELKALLESGMLDPKVLRVLGGVASSVVSNSEIEPRGVGMFGALGALRDADVQRALGFLLSIAADFGKSLKREHRKLPG